MLFTSRSNPMQSIMVMLLILTFFTSSFSCVRWLKAPVPPTRTDAFYSKATSIYGPMIQLNFAGFNYSDPNLQIQQIANIARFFGNYSGGQLSFIQFATAFFLDEDERLMLGEKKRDFNNFTYLNDAVLPIAFDINGVRTDLNLNGHAVAMFTDSRAGTEQEKAFIYGGWINYDVSLKKAYIVNIFNQNSLMRDVNIGDSRIFHTMIFRKLTHVAGGLGTFVVFGGLANSTPVGDLHVHTNDLLFGALPDVLDHPSPDDYNITWSNRTTEATGDIPSPRKAHTAVYDAVKDQMWVFGGNDGNVFFGDLFVLNVSNLFWEEVLVTQNKPHPRAFHTALLIGRVMYLYGGRDTATNIFGDLYTFNIDTRVWTNITSPYGANPPIGRYGHSMVAIRDSTSPLPKILISGGSSNFDQSILNSDWWMIDFNCFECNGYCVKDELECLAYWSCPNDTNIFRCGKQCIKNYAECPAYIASTCTGTQHKCWTGHCVDYKTQCLPWPSCPTGTKRCNGGTCAVSTDNTCVDPPPCYPQNLTQCVDGSCSEDCGIPNYGCVPGKDSILCDDGSCKQFFNQCNVICPGTNLQCWSGICSSEKCAENAYWKTPLPTVNASLTLPVYDTENFFIYHLYKQDPITTHDIMGILLIANQDPNPVTLDVSITGATHEDLLDENVGPHPLWKEWSNPQFIASPVYKINSDTWENPSLNNVSLNILFRKQVRNEQKPLCVAVLSPWYWHEADNSTQSPLANVPLIKQYRESFDKPNGTLPVTPKYRWRCTTLQDKFVFIQKPDYLVRLGLTGAKIDTWGVYALIENPSIAQEPDEITTPTTPQIPIIIAGGAVFLIFLLAMIISHATDENSPSLKCWKK